MYEHEIREARQFMHGRISTGECCSCGGECDTIYKSHWSEMKGEKDGRLD